MQVLIGRVSESLKAKESLTREATMSNATIVVKKATYLLIARKEKVTKARHLSQRRKTGQTLQILMMRSTMP